jgi:hypothetical protein
MASRNSAMATRGTIQYQPGAETGAVRGRNVDTNAGLFIWDKGRAGASGADGHRQQSYVRVCRRRCRISTVRDRMVKWEKLPLTRGAAPHMKFSKKTRGRPKVLGHPDR